MANVKGKERRKTSLMTIVLIAVYSIGFGILGLTLCVLIFLSVVAKNNQLITGKVFADFELVIVVGYLCIVIGLMFFVPFLTAKMIRKRGQSILKATEKIKAQDLDFDISSSGIKEIDQILESIDDMRLALKESLETQWRLEQNRKAQISALTHDFKTPITVLKGNIGLLKESELDDICKEYVEDASASLEQIEKYLIQLLEMARFERGYSVEKEKIELVEMLDGIVSMFMRMADEKDISIITENDKGNILISVDRILIERVFHNLISNALDFTPQKGTIKIFLTSDENQAVITITDSGCGFSPNALKHATEQFYMEDTSRGRKNHYGLGLYIVNSIIKQHNGTIEITNDELTGGARISIHLPLIKN
ncbi:sensor histidine kinase [Oceanirhabdus sp. W0125-5]|uniref:sensor histidine kinase n=1 Tax=Oceanirhabdus sp. W0125-5 TaxID=2999116 RepID=UPI0022F32A67|nr:HAMP domain-containing sensor histidine kinase [Oceanirhabdus sp. W0125-5]WBW95133.1 HAMP domain-containing sensor histidine kinase [Oceanirhabdus sp. W0125-5]